MTPVPSASVFGSPAQDALHCPWYRNLLLPQIVHKGVAPTTSRVKHVRQSVEQKHAPSALWPLLQGVPGAHVLPKALVPKATVLAKAVQLLWQLPLKR